MAANEQEANQDEQAQNRNARLRQALSNAYATLQGERTTLSFAAFTFEEALDAQIERIEGAGTQLRPNLLDRVDRIENQVSSAIAQIRALPPEAFVKADPDRDVNTPSEQEDE